MTHLQPLTPHKTEIKDAKIVKISERQFRFLKKRMMIKTDDQNKGTHSGHRKEITHIK